ncbi:MAG: ABC transporter permease [Planctomycetota bacterium]
MITWHVFQLHVRRLLQNRSELMLTFVVPIAFFSIFAVIFGGGVGSGSTPKIKVAVIDEVDTESSRRLVQSIRETPSLRLMRDDAPASVARTQAEHWVRGGSITLAIVVTQKDSRLAIDLLADSSDQVAPQVTSAIVTRCLAATGIHDNTDIDFRNTAGVDPASPPERFAALPSADGSMPGGMIAPPRSMLQTPLVDPQTLVNIVDVLGEGKSSPVISMYAAGIAVMFLLFGASGGGGALLEERENSTLDRLLSTRVTMDHLLLGKWFYQSALGMVQVSVMFIWAQVVFGVDLVGHLDGFIVMTVVTAATAAALGLMLATLCKTRGQLNGLSVVIVLSMSALGGSMVPRYLMSEGLREAGLWTFNAWGVGWIRQGFLA